MFEKREKSYKSLDAAKSGAITLHVPDGHELVVTTSNGTITILNGEVTLHADNISLSAQAVNVGNDRQPAGKCCGDCQNKQQPQPSNVVGNDETEIPSS
ncbi:hypothetical protein [Enterobacter soli]|uniref:hypothetical protein n=1 Tax=Enterobacter soli TaxID=885040 RepID=UPI002F42EE4A